MFVKLWHFHWFPAEITRWEIINAHRASQAKATFSTLVDPFFFLFLRLKFFRSVNKDNKRKKKSDIETEFINDPMPRRSNLATLPNVIS